MTNNLKVCNCALCGESLTAPQYYKGKMYGWSCITKVNPEAKKKKDNWQPCEFIGYKEAENDVKFPRVKYNGKNYIDYSYNYTHENIKRSIIQTPDNWLINLNDYKQSKLK